MLHMSVFRTFFSACWQRCCCCLLAWYFNIFHLLLFSWCIYSFGLVHLMLQEKLFTSKNRTEALLGKKLKNDMLPEIEKVHKVLKLHFLLKFLLDWMLTKKEKDVPFSTWVIFLNYIWLQSLLSCNESSCLLFHDYSEERKVAEKAT